MGEIDQRLNGFLYTTSRDVQLYAIAYSTTTIVCIHSTILAIAWLGAKNCSDPHPLTPSPHGEEGEPELLLLSSLGILLPSPCRRGVGGEVTTQIAPPNLLKSVRNASL